MDNTILLTPKEAFATIKVGYATGFRMIMSGELPSFKIGRLRRISADELKLWVAKQVAEAAEAR